MGGDLLVGINFLHLISNISATLLALDFIYFLFLKPHVSRLISDSKWLLGFLLISMVNYHHFLTTITLYPKLKRAGGYISTSHLWILCSCNVKRIIISMILPPLSILSEWIHVDNKKPVHTVWPLDKYWS